MQERKTVRVLLFDHTAVLGGAEFALIELVKEFDRKRVTPIVLLGSQGPLEELASGLADTHILPMDEKLLHARRDAVGRARTATIRNVGSALRYVLRLSRFLKQHDIDIIHTNSLKASVLGGLAGRIARCKVVWHVRDRIAMDYLPRRVVLVMRVAARVLPHFVIANSRATLQTLNLKGKPSAAIPSGVDLKSFRVEESRTQEVVKVVGLVGRICPWKGQHIFIEAASKVREQNRDVRFQIIGATMFGEIEYEAQLHALARRLEMTEAVEFTGFQNRIASTMRSLDILVHASTIGEPFGQVIVQGMASGKPVVATDGGGVSEIVIDGVTGSLVPMGDPHAMADAILKLLADPEDARRMGARGRARVEQHYTIEQSTLGVTGIYEALMPHRSIPYKTPHADHGAAHVG